MLLTRRPRLRQPLALLLLLASCWVACAHLVAAVQGPGDAGKCVCDDVAPPGRFSCAEQKQFDKCGKAFMQRGHFCAATCGRCMCDGTPAPADRRPEVFLATPVQQGAGDSDTSTPEQASEEDEVPPPMPPPAAPASPPGTPPATPPTPLPQPTLPPAAAAQLAVPILVVPVRTLVPPMSMAPLPPRVAPLPPPLPPPAVLSPPAPLPPPPAPPVPPPVPDVQPDVIHPCDNGTTVMSVILQNAANASTFRQALLWTGLESQLNDPDLEITVFVPTDEAFAQLAHDEGITMVDLLSRSAALRSILAYHLLPATVSPARLASQAGMPYEQTYWKDHLLFGGRPGYVYGEGTHAAILQSEQVCKSYIYYLDYVLLPTPTLAQLPPFQELKAEEEPPAVAPCNQGGTAFDALGLQSANMTATPNAMLVSGLGRNGLLSKADTPITFLAPNDAAWDAAARRLNTPIADLLEDKEKLRSILQYHVLAGYLPSAQLQSRLYSAVDSSVPPISVSVKPDMVTLQSTTTDASVVTADVGNACNVAVHIIDAVLLPVGLLPRANVTQVQASGGAN